MESELLEGTLENIDWESLGRVINRTTVIELAPNCRYLFVVHLDETAIVAKGQIETALHSLLGDEFRFQVLIVPGDFSLEAYRFGEASE